MANLLDHYDQNLVKKSDYMNLIRQYAQIHYSNGILDLQEDYDSADGSVIVGLDRSHHYFHSGFVSTGAIGTSSPRLALSSSRSSSLSFSFSFRST